MTLVNIVNLAYLLAAVLFIIGLKRLSSPATARSGNRMGATGMLIAVVVTLLDREVLDYTQIAGGVIVGAIVGATLARTIKMTAMPQMVAIFNGLGGGASALVASGEFHKLTSDAADVGTDVGCDHHAWHLHRRGYLLRQLHCVWEAAGHRHRPGDQLANHQDAQPDSVPDGAGPRWLPDRGAFRWISDHVRGNAAVPGAGGGVARAGHTAGDAHRRSGHAGCDSAAELILRTGCRSRRFRAWTTWC